MIVILLLSLSTDAITKSKEVEEEEEKEEGKNTLQFIKVLICIIIKEQQRRWHLNERNKK